MEKAEMLKAETLKCTSRRPAPRSRRRGLRRTAFFLFRFILPDLWDSNEKVASCFSAGSARVYGAEMGDAQIHESSASRIFPEIFVRLDADVFAQAVPSCICFRVAFLPPAESHAPTPYNTTAPRNPAHKHDREIL
jgi:hypothetical protein